MSSYFEQQVADYGIIDFVMQLKFELDIEIERNDVTYSILPEEVNRYELKRFIDKFKLSFIETLQRLTDDEKILILNTLHKEYSKEFYGHDWLMNLIINNPFILDKYFPNLQDIKEVDKISLSKEDHKEIYENYSMFPIIKECRLEILDF